MKLNEKVTEVFECDENEKKFNIIANDKMFKILSSKIYANKILAPIRELSTNAYDAHVECGKKEIPFEVHIPSTKEKYFSVRDFGKGLFPKEVEQLYTTYGYSSKSESNDYVGCLGLGSKSPFAYVNNFKVVSFKEGKKYSYICYMDNGVPKINAFDVCDTKEPSGMLIEFNVLTEDIINFYHECLRFFEWFDVKPVFTGANMEFKENKVWRHDVEVSGSSRDGGILMGNIFYPITHEWDDFCLSKKIDYEKIRLVRNKLVLKAEIGDFDISVSRESLEITEKNVKKINELVESFLKTEEEDYIKVVSEQKTNVEKLIVSREFLRERFSYLKINSCLPDDLLFFRDNFIKEDSEDVLFKFYRKNGKTCAIGEQFGNHIDFATVFAKEYIVVFDEKCRGSDMFRQYVKQSNESFVIVTSNKNLLEWCKEQGFIEKNREEFVSFKAKKDKTKKDIVLKLIDYNVGTRVYTKNVSLSHLQDEDKIYYCLLEKNCFIYEDVKNPTNFLGSMRLFLGKPIYGLTKKQLNYFENDERFISVQKIYKNIKFDDIDLLKIKSAANLGDYRFIDMLRAGVEFNEKFMNKEELFQYQILKNRSLFSKEDIISKFNKKEELFFNLIERNEICEISDFISYCFKNFPMLKVLMRITYCGFAEEDILAVKDYIKIKEKEIERNI